MARTVYAKIVVALVVSGLMVLGATAPASASTRLGGSLHLECLRYSERYAELFDHPT